MFMISTDIRKCPDCGGSLKPYDTVSRVLRGKGRKKICIQIHRYKCEKCHKIHRENPKNAVPYKQYEAEIISGVLDGFITSDTLGFEDFPSEATMKRWRKCMRKDPDEPTRILLFLL